MLEVETSEGCKQRNGDTVMGNTDGGILPRPGACPSLLPSQTLLFVHGGPGSCMEASVGDGTGPEGNELSVPARTLVPTPSRAPSEESKRT